MSDSAPMGVNEIKLKRAFLEEAEELLQKLGKSLLLLEGGGEYRELLNEIFRLVHSLKSESALLGYHKFSTLAHGMEDVLDSVRSGETVLDKALMDKIFGGVDLLSEMLSSIASGGSDTGLDAESVISALTIHPEPEGENRPAALAAETGNIRFNDLEKRRLAEARDRGETFYRVSVTVEESESMKLARVFLVFTNLELLSNVVRVVPPVTGETANDESYRTAEIFLTTNEEESRIMAAAEVDQIKYVDIGRMDRPGVPPRRKPPSAWTRGSSTTCGP
jgi:two-component system chemotaxis sensor kinase CheA